MLEGKAEITAFDRHLSEDEAAALLQPFDILCTEARGLLDQYLTGTDRRRGRSDRDSAIRPHRRCAGLDVFDVEPLPADHPLRTMDNVTLTANLGYVTSETLRAFYTDTLEAVVAYVDGAPIRVANPDALAHPKQRQ